MKTEELNTNQKPDELTIERYNELIEETKLGPILHSYRDRGYDFILQTSGSQMHTSIAQIKEKRIWLSVKDLNNSRFSEAVTFLSLVLHELGHCEAYERGLKHSDEILAWKIAAEICPIPLPEEWGRLRSYALTSYGLRVQTEPLDQEQTDFLQSTSKCPMCRIGNVYGCPIFNSMKGLPADSNRKMIMTYICLDCDAGYANVYRMVGKEPIFEQITFWELANE